VCNKGNPCFVKVKASLHYGCSLTSCPGRLGERERREREKEKYAYADNHIILFWESLLLEMVLSEMT